MVGRQRRSPRARLVRAICVALLVAGEAAAATFAVDSGVDGVDAAPGDGVCAMAASGCSLRAAVQEANALPGADTITLGGGFHFLTLLGGGEDLAATGDLDVTDDLTIRGAAAPYSATCMSCTSIQYFPIGSADDRHFHVHGANLVLENVSLHGGRAPAGENGGNVVVDGGSLTASNAGITGGQAVDGGSIYVASGSSCSLSGVSVDGTASGRGGGVYGNCSISGGSVSGAATVEGGGIYGQVEISDAQVSNGTAGDGGGIYALGASSLTRVQVFANLATGAGGGVLVGAGAAATMRNVVVRNNRARSGGGGLLVRAGGAAVANNASILRNTADDDGNGSGDGGGVAVEIGAGLAIGNSIVAQNVDNGGEAPDGSGTVDSAGHNLFQETAGLAIAGDPTGNLVGVDPGFQALLGLFFSGAVHPDSPAIQAGSPLLPGSGGSACEADDVFGAARPLGPRCDIGAVESSAYCGNGVTEWSEECDAGAATAVCGADCRFVDLIRDAQWYGAPTCADLSGTRLDINAPFGQTFMPSEPVLGAVSLNLGPPHPQAVPPYAGNVTVNLREGSPTGPLLATSTRAVALSTVSGELFRFSRVARVVPGASYALELIADTPAVGARISQDSHPLASCDYADGTPYVDGSPDEGYDVLFKTFSTCPNGTREPGESCDDGNDVDGDGCESDCEFASEFVSELAPAGGTVSTEDSSGATPTDPIETTVSTPNAGTVSIEEGVSAPAPTGYSILGQQVDISAPPATPADPLVIAFRLDDSAIPHGMSPAQVAILRNGALVLDCAVSPPVADPDPCVESRAVLADGDFQFVVRTSAASIWTAAVAESCGNGLVELGETCDDGGLVAGDGCSESCLVEAGWQCLAEGEPCSAICGDNLVVGPEECDDGNGAGGDCCDADCRLPSCAAAAKSVLVIADKANPAQDRLVWKWLKGTTPFSSFGTPTSSPDGFQLCVWDGGELAMSAAVAGGGQCGTSPCWKATGPAASPNGYLFKSAVPATQGATRVLLKSGSGNAKVLWQGKGATLPLPGPVSASAYLDAGAGVLVQLIARDGSGCWQSEFSAARKNRPDLFKATSP